MVIHKYVHIQYILHYWDERSKPYTRKFMGSSIEFIYFMVGTSNKHTGGMYIACALLCPMTHL